MLRNSIVAVFALVMGATSAPAQVGYPMVTHAHPCVVERGKTADFAIGGQLNFDGAFAVYIEGAGAAATVKPSAEPKEPNPGRRGRGRGRGAIKVTATVTVAPDAPLGVREFRVGTPQGVSSVGQIIVTDHAVVVESEQQHATRESAQAVPIGSAVGGVISAQEQVDFYKITAKAGQEITAAIASARLMDKIHDLQDHFDPIISIYDSSGAEVASNDDYYFADPMVRHKFEQNGDYTISVRDVRFAGDPRWTYCLWITDRPFVTAWFPLAVKKASPLKFDVEGVNLPAAALEGTLTGPQTEIGKRFLPLQAGPMLTNPVPVELTDLDCKTEAEPNNKVENANAVPLGVIVNGRIAPAGDVDSFVFALKKGVQVRFEVKARRYDSMLDSFVRVLNDKGGVAATSDDFARTKDSIFTFNPPADGNYVFELRDLLNRGGSNFAYALEARLDAPSFELVCDDDKAGIAPGTGSPWFIKLTRNGGFAGPVTVRVEGLPEGITASPLVIGPSMTQGCIVLEAADSNATKPVLAAVRVIGKAEVAGPDGKPIAIEREAQPVSEIYLPGGGRGIYEVDTQMVQVSPENDIAAVKVTPEKIDLKPGAKVTLNVEVARRESYKDRVTLDVILRHLGGVHGNPLPPGVTMVDGESKTSLAPNETKGTIVLKADANAKPIENVPVAVLANVSINFVVKRAYSSKPVLVSVVESKPVAAAK